ncbi:hypothetical protein [Orenia marismortui]|uniref:hypothetical protein n=1 Tax=Orenia marismortui TaxID=46469 RepID=UPI000362300E|nr:hypothetical protein [Orenia marismortui]
MSQTTGIILEGIPATGKSTIISEMLSRSEIINRDFMSLFTFGEDITQRVLERKDNKGKITKDDNLNLLNDILTPLEKYKIYYQKRGWIGDKKEHRYGFILERFHLTHANYFSHMGWEDVIDVDQRLLKLNSKLCFLTMEKKVMEERIIHSRGEEWRKYISRFANSNKEIVNYYYQQQQNKRMLVDRSSLPKLILDTSTKNWGEIVDEIISFWGI